MLEDRIARITIPTRNVMQSGSSKLDRWVVNWDTEERWENPLMGWISS
jgi:NADH dehydrogenase (ubiquinone) Fe-S protein 4